jgi:hypothetical protein
MAYARNLMPDKGFKPLASLRGFLSYICMVASGVASPVTSTTNGAV